MASYTEGNKLYVVGVATESTEAISRQQAFENGQKEFFNFFQSASPLPNINTQRIFTSKLRGKFYTCRLMWIDLSRINIGSYSFSFLNQIGESKGNLNKVTILTNPPGADLIVSGNPIGKTNVVLEKISPGAHKITIIKDGFQPVEKSIEVDRDLIFSFVLKKKTADITIRTNVREGRLFLNDKEFQEISSGSTNVTVNVGETYNIKIDSPRYFPSERKILVTPTDTDIDVSLQLTPFPSTISVVSDPSGAEIYLNDRSYGVTPKSFTIQPGLYEIIVAKKGYVLQKQRATLSPDEKKVFPTMLLVPLSLEQKRIDDDPWKLALAIGLHGSTIQDHNAEPISIEFSGEKKFAGLVGLKMAFEYASGGSETGYQQVGPPNTQTKIIGKIRSSALSIASSIYFRKSFYVSPEFGVSRSIASVRTINYDSSGSSGSSDGNTPKDSEFMQSFSGAYLGYEGGSADLFVNIGFRKYSDTESFKGGTPYLLRIGVLTSF
jgi:hypothetical protein